MGLRQIKATNGHFGPQGLTKENELKCKLSVLKGTLELLL